MKYSFAIYNDYDNFENVENETAFFSTDDFLELYGVVILSVKRYEGFWYRIARFEENQKDETVSEGVLDKFIEDELIDYLYTQNKILEYHKPYAEEYFGHSVGDSDIIDFILEQEI